jgi:hypothetical protein
MTSVKAVDPPPYASRDTILSRVGTLIDGHETGRDACKGANMAIFRIRRGGTDSPLNQAHAQEAARPASQDARGTRQGQLGRDYESPAVIVIGSVRDLTAGSASSGNADANSQFYW